MSMDRTSRSWRAGRRSGKNLIGSCALAILLAACGTSGEDFGTDAVPEALRTSEIKAYVQQSFPDPGTSFSFTADKGLSPASFSLKSGGLQSLKMDGGLGQTYRIQQIAPENTVLLNMWCNTGTTDLRTGTWTFTLLGSERPNCTFNNGIAPGTLKIKKTTIDPNGGTFAFEVQNGPTPKAPYVTANGPGTYETSTELAPGTYTISEVEIQTFQLTQSGCDQPMSGSGNTTFAIASGQTVTCEFTNRQKGEVTLYVEGKGNAPETYGFASTFPGEARFDIKTAAGWGSPYYWGVKTFGIYDSKQYRITPTSIPQGWSIGGITGSNCSLDGAKSL